MNCPECGQRVLPGAQFCSACGRRVTPERNLELMPDPDARHPVAAPARKASHAPLVIKKLPPRPSYATRLSQAIAGWRHAPVAVVALGCVLAVAAYWSDSRDESLARKAGRERIAAATGARSTTSQVATPGKLEFSARQALQSFYGNYDPVLDGAFWTVTGAPKRWSDWNGKSVLIKPLVSRPDDAGTRHVLVTHSVDMKNGMVVKQGAGCRSCKSLIGAALFERQGAEWKLVSDQRFLGVEGAFGAPPHVAVTFPATSGVELRIEPPGVAQAEAGEPAPGVVMNAGRAVKGVLASPRPRPRETTSPDTPFPTAVTGP